MGTGFQPKNNGDLWDSEEVGGFESYVEVDPAESEELAEVYRENPSEGPLLNIPPVHNALSVVMRDKHTMSFLKYVSVNAPSSRIDIKAVFNVEDDDADSEEESGVTDDDEDSTP